MKKYSLLIAGLLMLAAIPILIFAVKNRQELRQKAAPATTLSLLPANVTKREGDTFSLEVGIDTGPNQIVIAELHLTFDPAKLEAVSITNGPLFSRIYASGVVGGGTASITVGASDELHPIKGTGTAAVVRFKALARTDAPISIRLVPTTTFVGGLGEGSSNLLTGSTPATITITAGTGESQTAPTSTPTISTARNTPTPTTRGARQASQTTGTPTPTLNTTPTPTKTGTPSPTPSTTITTTPTPTSTTQQLKVTLPAANTTISADNLVISGKAKPGATITVTIYSDPLTFTTTADQLGNWSITPTGLVSGPHNIVVTATDTAGASETASTSFILSNSTNTDVPVTGSISTTLLLIMLGSGLLVLGIIPLLR